MSLMNPSMEDLPPDVMADILTRLPVKTIIYSTCVCKKWRNLVSSSYFVNLHLSRSPPSLIVSRLSRGDLANSRKAGILKWVEIEDELDRHHLHHDPVMTLDLNLSSTLRKSKVLLMGSVNGLICLSQPKGGNTCICNPITREYMILSRNRDKREDYSTFVCGFGVVCMTGEYKVMRTFEDSNSSSRPRQLQAEVYTLGTGRWRNIGHVPYWFDHSDQPFLNGHIHWRIYDEDSPESLCAFDLDKETFRLFPSPPSESIEESYMHFQSLAVLKGCLCKSDTYDSRYTIWVMTEYGIKKSWRKELVVKLGIIPDLDWLIWEPMFLIEGLKDGSILMVCREERLLVYCPQSKTIEHTEMFEPYFSGLPYRPSFLKLRDFASERVRMF
ncbi:F-box/kelch-repeat protein At3g06240-like [Cynara cardunculus var. scolymus]|uniref:F-box associated domain, type 1 n=1 Tax=Cynara cardunculus var. scolymus TaxID=59895 RepID=A0A118K0Z0_CYNCS|nr:F-box/kelch-repeat protein At3g06240-like [Cynara cardunculus var. scolymus]KVI02070.1 F-box associated domain, type 1 [Cynara cardunculus var. scolymus]